MRSSRQRNLGRLALVLLAASISNGACERRSQAGPQLDVAWTLRPPAPVVGPATLTVTLRGPSGHPVRGAMVRLEAHMSHAGMAPVLADGTEGAPGVYDFRFAFTMQGDWVLLVSAVLADGARLERRIDVVNVRPSG